jgi:glycosyltransferase involved in cell wall biosynthesis
VNVAIDTSPLRQTRAGTARYLEAMLPHIERLVAVRRLAWGGAGRASAVARDALWYPLALRRAARGADVLHCPSFRGPASSEIPLVVTVHDLAVLRHPEVFNRWTRAYSRAFVPCVVRAAQRVIAVSEFTNRELVELLRVPAERIRVVPNGVDAAFAPEGARAGGEYVLAVGTLEPRKNLPRLASAARRAGIELRVAGARGWGNVRVGGDGVSFLGFVGDDELAALYRGALCVAYPSLYEGFGIPVLEALACGAPVVTSAGSAMAELADGAAVLVDPRDEASIADGIREAIARRDELSTRGPAVARGYSWQRSAELTVDVYRELV